VSQLEDKVERLEGAVDIAHKDQRILAGRLSKANAHRSRVVIQNMGLKTEIKHLEEALVNARQQRNHSDKRAADLNRRVRELESQLEERNRIDDQREEFTRASKHTALALNKLVAVLSRALLSTGEMRQVQDALNDSEIGKELGFYA
jgi:chromosome segregation ATPase